MRLSNQDAIAALEGAITRVRAVAETHRALNESTDLRNVAFDRILHDLCRHSAEFNPDVTITCKAVGTLQLDAERAMPLGMIVSEALTNAVRHAYPPGQKGEVSAHASEHDGIVVIEVVDRGVGYSPAQQPTETRLGTTIIRLLSQQIGAELQIDAEPGQGTTMTIRLPRHAAIGGC